MKSAIRILWVLVCCSICSGDARAHDTWVQTNTQVVRAGEAVFIDLMLGNHGNDHRDFKLAGKPDLGSSTLNVFAPNAASYDLLQSIIDTGYAPSEGFWSARFVGVSPGLYLVAHTSDKVVSYAPLRSIKSAKTFFVVTPSLDKVHAENPGFDRPLGHPLELVPVSNPVTPMGPGKRIDVQVLYLGKPLDGARLSFIPRGTTLREGFDERYERNADADGKASFTPTEGNRFLVVVHKTDPAARGKGYDGTKYSATLTVLVPQMCPCCDTIEE
jgi:uncharacterized GH25 family protein